MNIVLGIAAGSLIFGLAIFALVATAGWLLEFLTSEGRSYAWWSAPLWVAAGMGVFLPLLAASMFLALVVFVAISGVGP